MATFDIQAARDAGYTEEEIQGFLRKNPKLTVSEEPPAPTTELAEEPPAPTTQVQPIDRTNSTMATAAGGIGDVVAAVAPYATGAFLGKQALDIVGKRLAGPVAPSVSSSGVQLTGVGSPSQPLGGPAISQAGAASEGMAARGAQTASRAVPGVGSMALPLAALTAPYLMAAQEQAKIRENPYAPGLEKNPYAMVQRGEAKTQGQAGARNAREAVANMPSGYTPSAQEARNLLASGDERTINIYGGRQKLQSIANPNAINSGYAQELNRLGR